MHDQLTIDEIEFETRFQPFLAADGSWQDFLWTDDAACNAAVAKAALSRSLWTLVDVDGFTLVISGQHFVNRLAYYITAVPVPEGESVQVYDSDELEEWNARERAEADV